LPTENILPPRYHFGERSRFEFSIERFGDDPNAPSTTKGKTGSSGIKVTEPFALCRCTCGPSSPSCPFPLPLFGTTSHRADSLSDGCDVRFLPRSTERGPRAVRIHRDGFLRRLIISHVFSGTIFGNYLRPSTREDAFGFPYCKGCCSERRRWLNVGFSPPPSGRSRTVIGPAFPFGVCFVLYDIPARRWDAADGKIGRNR